MTLDELIAKLQRLRETQDGITVVKLSRRVPVTEVKLVDFTDGAKLLPRCILLKGEAQY